MVGKMDNLIYTYALVKSFYDHEGNYIACFLPFVIKSFSKDQFTNYKTIQKEIKNKFQLDIPLHVLEAILKQGENKGYLKKKKKLDRYKLTNEGHDYLNNLESDKEVTRRINALMNDIGQFFQQNHVHITLDQTKTLICNLLTKNLKTFIEFIDPSSANEMSINVSKDYEKILIDYIENAENNDPDKYETIKDMVFGSLVSTVIRTKDPSDLNAIKNKWSKCEVYLDANFVFYILDLYTPEFNEPAKELFNLLKKHNFDIKVFDFTLDEISTVIYRYPKESNKYPDKMKIDTLYSSLNSKGWKNSDAIEFVADLREILEEKGIKIKDLTHINLNNYQPKETNLRNKIAEYKPNQGIYYQNHDLAAIEKIKEYRKREVRKIEDSKVLFLTSDASLSKFNFIKMGHQINGTICEVILDKFLTNFLWLKYPNAEISLKAIIESYSRDLFIKKRIWNKFFNILKDLNKKGKIKNPRKKSK